ncbi:MAG: hypothetical protein LBS61_01000 [Endomicrobium sp.]|jgi:hypothetical protein|nr:hypothetical protein [Endomicrobium sp.]
MRIEINENEEELKKALTKIFLQDDKEKSMKPIANEFQNAVGFYEKRGFKVDFVRSNGKNARSDKCCLSKKRRGA